MFKNVSRKESVSLDNICYLIDNTEVGKDSKGNSIIKTSEYLCYCAEKSAISSEYWNAGKQGVKASTTLLIDSENYNKQIEAKYNDTNYSIYRTFIRDDGFIELYLSEKAGV